MFSVDDLELQGQIYVTSIPAVTPGQYGIPGVKPGGVIYANGGAFFGSPLNAPVTGTVVINHTTDPILAAAGGVISSLVVHGTNKPTDIILGSPVGPAGLTVNGPTCLYAVATTTITGAVEGKGALTWNGVKLFQGAKSENGAKSDNGAKSQTGAQAKTGAQTDTGPRTTAGPSTGLTFTQIQAELAAVKAIAGKGFDIPHPTKKDHRLRYICLEGPEVGAYLRGTLKDSNVIELPDYWTKLVYPESITVNLTPVGHYQELFVEKIEWGSRIKIKNNAGGAIHCYYTIFAERVTHDKLQVEYKGLTPDDYPGDNTEYALGGWDYARHKGEPKSPSL